MLQYSLYAKIPKLILENYTNLKTFETSWLQFIINEREKDHIWPTAIHLRLIPQHSTN